MIKGIISLFTSGAIFNPMVLLGIFLGVYCMVEMKETEIKELFGNYHFYLIVLVVSVIYTAIFKQVYKERGRGLDYAAMSWQVVAGVLKLVFASLLTMSFIFMLSF